MYDELVSEHEFLDIHPAVAACYDTIISGVATEMIPRLFLTGSWGNPVPEHTSDSLGADDAEFLILHALRVRGFALPEAVAEAVGVPETTVHEILATTTERGHTKERTGRLAGFALTPAGRARHVLLRRNFVSRSQLDGVREAYDAFLDPNGRFKALTTQSQMGEIGAEDLTGRLSALDDEVSNVIAIASAAVPRFSAYRSRFASALQRFRAGDATALAQPMSGSYHDVWMELHEDLLVTLGQERGDSDE